MARALSGELSAPATGQAVLAPKPFPVFARAVLPREAALFFCALPPGSARQAARWQAGFLFGGILVGRTCRTGKHANRSNPEVVP